MLLNAELVRVIVGMKCPSVFKVMLEESMRLVQWFGFYAKFFYSKRKK